jgi:hypothetical protein
MQGAFGWGSLTAGTASVKFAILHRRGIVGDVDWSLGSTS